MEAQSRQNCVDALASSGSLPVNFAVFQDGSPALTWHREIRKLNNEKTIIREAGHSIEALIQRAFVQVGGSTPLLREFVCPPRPLGKHTHRELYQANVDWFVNPRTLKKNGVLFITYHQDRGGGHSLTRMLVQRVLDYLASLPATPANALLAKLTWIEEVPCTLHDLQASFMEAVDEVTFVTNIKRRLLGKDVFKTTRSLRESLSDIIERLDAWVLAHVSWHTDEEPYDECLCFWTLTGVDTTVAESLAEWNAKFHSGRLWVSARFREDPDILVEIGTALFAVLHVRKYKEGRWISEGAGAGMLIAGEALGLKSLVTTVLDDPSCGDWYLQCYRCFLCPARFPIRDPHFRLL